MKIEILHMIEGAKKATGIAVIIDVFRAFTVEAYLMNNGAEKIIPIGDLEKAYRMKQNHPEYVLLGERKGAILEGFEYGNSPSQIKDIDFSGKTMIHTTEAGTQGLANCTQAKEILTGSLVNSRAIAKYIKSSSHDTVSLVCMGLAATKQTQEDNLCAEYIKSLLEGKTMELKEEIEKLKTTSGAKFSTQRQAVFPQEDFYLSTQVDKFDFVLKLERQENELGYIKKIDNLR